MKFTKWLAIGLCAVVAWLAVLGVATLLVMLTGCGGAPFTEAPGTAADALVADGGARSPDVAPTLPQDAISDAGGGEGGRTPDAGPQRVVEPDAGQGPGCWRTPGARACPAGAAWLAVTCTPGVLDPQAFDSYLECLLVGTGAGTQPRAVDDAGMLVFCCADNAQDH